MELGQRIREARQAAGLSQRQLCGDVITRNMLSLIENGSARPSMDTLCYLAARLEKPVSYFLQETTASENQTRILAARQAPVWQAPEILRDYRGPDGVFDPEYHLLMALGAMALAERALDEDRPLLARNSLEQAAEHGGATVYYTPELERRRILLCRRAGLSAGELAAGLPDLTAELLLLAEAALEAADPERCGAYLEAITRRDARWYYLRGESCLARQDYAQAARFYHQAEDAMPRQVYPRLERCYEALEDYKQAYLYACKQRLQHG